MTDEKVTVKIEWSERVKYYSEVTMPKKEFEKLNAKFEDDDRDDSNNERIVGWANRDRDWMDSDDIEIDELEVVEP